jgi:hypothetical protein
MNQKITFQNDSIVIDNLVTTALGVTGSLDVTGDSVMHSVTADTIVADTLRVKNLITDQAVLAPNTEWVANTTDDLNGRGLKWVHNTETTQLIYRSGGRLWNSNSFDIPLNASYMIDEIPVLSANSLGSSITRSNLRQVGPLQSLDVTGDASLSGFAFFNSVSNRLGLGTSDPSSSISIIDNNVEISIGSPTYNVAHIGTRSNHDVAIISDDLPRLVVKGNGEVHIGNSVSKAGVLRVFGSLYADVIVSDTRVDRTSSLEFNDEIYNKGLLWVGSGQTKQFIMRESPDRFWSTESIDIKSGKSYYINDTIVLSETSLGNSVLDSKLTSVGTLKSLAVSGGVDIGGTISVSQVSTPLIKLDNNLSINKNGILANTSFSVAVNNLPIFYSSSDEIVLGNKEIAKTPIKVFGPMSIGINNPDPSVSLSVSGVVSFDNKKFVTGENIPVSGNYSKGDICWNNNPIETGYVGWICIRSGTPGEWKPFGALGV